MAKYIRIGRVLHTVTTDANGNEVYDPPLSGNMQKMFEENKKSFVPDLRRGKTARLRGTDTDFHRGRMTIREQFQGDEAWLRRFDKEYRKQTGMALPTDGVWLGQLAESQFDAKAVIRPTQGHAEVRGLINRFNRKQQELADRPPVRLAEDLIQEKVNHYKKTGEGMQMSDSELRHYVVEKHGQKV